MESILDCYFENVFSELARSSLLSWHKRQELTEYFTTVIESCSSLGECTLQEGCQTAVVAALAYHDKSKSNNGEVCLFGKFHNVLYLAVKLAYDFRLEDTPLVAKLLNTIFVCEGTFERIFAGAIFGVRVTHFISGWKSDFKDQDENLLAVVYFLEHANKAKLRFQVGPLTKRLIDVPMSSVSNSSPLRVAVQIPRPEIVLILLQYGSAVKFDQGDGCSSSPLEPLLKLMSESTLYPLHSLYCLKYLLRAFPTIGYLPAQQPDPTNFQASESICVEDRLIQDKVIPISRCGGTPPELKHLCRCTIRHELWLRWQLPFGIPHLPLPLTLMEYLNLMED